MSKPSDDSGNPASPAESDVRWALGHAPSHLRLWIVAVCGVVADLWTKDLAFEKLAPGQSKVLVENLCSLQVSLNPGALFGLGAGFAPVFVGASVLALMFVLYLFANSTVKHRSMHIALGLVLAGAIGNLYDRATQEAYVAHFPGKGRVIGVLHEQTKDGLTMGDFPDGANPRLWRGQVDSATSGVQPVVRDFVKIEAKIGSISLWPWVFNVADALLVIGVAVLLINFWWDRKRYHRSKGASGQPA